MAFNRVSALSVIGLLLFAAANPSAAQSPPNMIHGLIVGGRLCCSPNGNCPGVGGVGGVAVNLDCTVRGRSVGFGVDITNNYGSFNITIPSSNDLKFDSPFIPCFVIVALPTLLAMNCTALSNSTGVLISGLRSIGTGNTNSLGLVRNATIKGFMKYSI